jgi:hypothetical protein
VNDSVKAALDEIQRERADRERELDVQEERVREILTKVKRLRAAEEALRGLLGADVVVNSGDTLSIGGNTTIIQAKEPQPSVVEEATEPPDVRVGETVARVVDVVRSGDHPLRVNEILREMGVRGWVDSEWKDAHAATYAALRRGMEAGLLCREKRRWSAVGKHYSTDEEAIFTDVE